MSGIVDRLRDDNSDMVYTERYEAAYAIEASILALKWLRDNLHAYPENRMAVIKDTLTRVTGVSE